MGQQTVSPDYSALMKKKNDVIISICDLFKEAQYLLSAKNFADDKEFFSIQETLRLCVNMLQAYVG